MQDKRNIRGQGQFREACRHRGFLHVAEQMEFDGRAHVFCQGPECARKFAEAPAGVPRLEALNSGTQCARVL